MKHLALVLLLLVGCATEPPPPPVAPPDPPPVMIARGTDGFIDWKCQIEDFNDKLVWVPCEFHNRNPGTTTGACIQVTFYDRVTMKPVVESRKFCSGILRPDENKTNYAAFIKEKRQALQRCGELLDLCVMLAGPAQK